jgi:hypothetical protein
MLLWARLCLAFRDHGYELGYALAMFKFFLQLLSIVFAFICQLPRTADSHTTFRDAS